MVETDAAAKKVRVGYFDAAKALAILAVICGHTAIRFLGVGRGATLTFATCFTFHLPLFFMVSGYFLHVDRPFSWKREAKTLILPYAFTAAAVVVGVCACNLWLHDWGSTRQLLYDWANAALYGAGDIPAHPLWPQNVRIGAIWFLLALFWARLVVVLAHKTPAPAVVVAASFVLGYVSSTYVFLPFDVQSGLCAAAFVYLGTLARRYRVFDESVLPVWVWPCLAAVWVWAILCYDGFGMAMCAYGSTPVAFVRNVAGGIAGTMCIIGICMAAERFLGWSSPYQLLCSLGRITLPIMCVHLFEDDVVRWGWVVDFTARAFGHMSFAWLIVLAIRVILDVAIARFLIKLPVVSVCLGAPRKVQDPGEEPSDGEDPIPSWGNFGWEGKLLLVLVIPCVVLITYLAAVTTADINIATGMPKGNEDLMVLTGLANGDLASVVVPAILALVLLACIVAVVWLLRRANPDILCAVCMLVILVIQVLWIRALGTTKYLYVDSMSVEKLARDYLNGTYAEFKDPIHSVVPYLSFYPFQACTTWFLIACYVLFGVGNQMAYFVINAVCNVFTFLGLYLLLRHAFPKRPVIGVAYCVLMGICTPLWFSCVFLYANMIGLAFGVWGILFSVKAIDTEDRGDRLAKIIWSFFLLAISCFTKSTYVLFVLAAIVLWVVYALRSRHMGAIPCVLLCAYLASQSANLGVRAMERIVDIDFGRGLPKTTWIAMGINNHTEVQLYTKNMSEADAEAFVQNFAESEWIYGPKIVDPAPLENGTLPEGQKRVSYYRKAVPGWWRWDMYDAFLATNNDYDKQNEIQIAHIKELVEGYIANPQSAIDFFGAKLATEWANPDLMTLYYSSLGDNHLGGVENYLIYQDYPSARYLRVGLDAFQNLVYWAALATLLGLLVSKRRLNASLAGILVCFLTGFLCFVLWEAKSVYVLPYFFLLVPVAAVGLGALVQRFGGMRSENPIVVAKGTNE